MLKLLPDMFDADRLTGGPAEIFASEVIGTAFDTRGLTSLQLIALDELKVVEGVFDRDQITSARDLVPGDVFQLPRREVPAACTLPAAGTSIDVFTPSRFGPPRFAADITHSVIFMSEIGKTLTGYVLNGSRNADDRPSVIIGGDSDASARYVLIELNEGRKDADWPATATAAPTKHREGWGA